MAIQALGVGPAEAKGKPPKPPQDPVDTGIIYFTVLGTPYTMDPEGDDTTEIDTSGEPSIALHGSERWFLQVREIAGESYPSGEPRHELYAVSESGTAVQLTDDEDVQPNMPYDNPGRVEPRWAADDTLVSYLATHWDGDTVDEGGVYVVEVDPDDLDSHDADAPTLVLEFTLLENTSEDYGKFLKGACDWAPDGSAIVYGEGAGLYRVDEADGFSDPTELDSRTAWDPRWAPEGDKIAYKQGTGAIWTVNSDGTEAESIVLNPKKAFNWVGNPRWSPSGTHLIYMQYGDRNMGKKFPMDLYSDIYRCTAGGGGRTKLMEDAAPVSWRGE